MKNIIFFVDAKKSASGGAKIIYQYSSYINSLTDFISLVPKTVFVQLKYIFKACSNPLLFSPSKFK